MTIKADRGAKALLKMDKDFQKVFTKAIEGMTDIIAGRKGLPGQQILLNNFRKPWRSQRKFDDLEESTKEQKERSNPPEDFILVSSGDLGKAVKRNTKSTVRGNKITIEANVPDYGLFIQEGTEKMAARPFFSIKGFEKLVYDLIENLLVLELKRVGIKSKEI